MSPSAASTIRFFAIVHFDFELRHFIIESPDFSDLHETCQKFGDIEEVARRTIRTRLEKMERESGTLPTPTPKTSLETNPEYRECFLIGIEPD